MQNEFSEVLSIITSLLNSLNLRYCIGGSVASGLRSQFRATLDIDVLVEFLSSDFVIEFCNKAKDNFYVYEDAALEANSLQKSFNIIHKKSFIKIDLFTSFNDFSKSELSRATLVTIPNTELKVKIATAEDMIINKLVWYKLGNCQSERQWNDLSSLIFYNKNSLDYDYLKKWAKYKEVEELLNKLIG